MALKVNDVDNVATTFEDLKKGVRVLVTDKRKQTAEYFIQDDIPYGHKFAIAPIRNGEEIRKYGEVIGVATKNIAIGEHVHVHNLESTRGRGDLKGGKTK